MAAGKVAQTVEQNARALNDTAEAKRLNDKEWKKWGPYLSERQWGTVREDYSANGDAWDSTTHDMARSKSMALG